MTTPPIIATTDPKTKRKGLAWGVIGIVVGVIPALLFLVGLGIVQYASGLDSSGSGIGWLGIALWFLAMYAVVVTAPLGLIFGVVAIVRGAKASRKAGLVTGVIATVIAVAAAVFYLVLNPGLYF